MAGGWGHITNDDGTPYNGEYGMGGLLENGGDVTEFVTEVYGMVWYLAYQLARTRRAYGEPSRQQILDVIEEARRNDQAGRTRGRSGI